MSQTMFSFEVKLRLFVYSLVNKILNHFPRVKANVKDIKEKTFDEYKQIERITSKFQT